MDGVDTFFSIIIIVSVLLGLGMGMIRGILPLISIFIAVFIAGQFYGGWAGNLSSFLKIVVFLLVFIGTFIVVNMFGLKLYTFLTANLHLGWIDRIGGGALGLMGGLIFIGLIVILMIGFHFGISEELFAQSKIVPYSVSMMKLLLKILPEEFSANVYSLNIV